MANPTRVEGDVYVSGALGCLTLTPPAGSITDAAVIAAANVAATKLEHQFVKHYSQESNTDSAVDRRCIHYAYGVTGSVIAFEAGSVTPCTGTAASITVNLLKGNSSSTSLASILAAAIVLDAANTALVAEAGSISSAALVDGDSLFVDVAVAGGTAVGHGAFASCVIREKAT